MPFSIEANFDADAEARVRALWLELADAGLCSVMLDVGARPHLSLAVYPRAPIAPLARVIESFTGEWAPIPLEVKSVGVFPGDERAVYLAPAVTPELLRFHASFHRAAEPLGLEQWPHYVPGRWMPHCTVAMEMPAEHIGPIVEVCRRAAAVGPLRLVEVGLVEFRPVRSHVCHLLGRSG